MTTEELFKQKIAEQEIGDEFGELVSVSDCVEYEDACYLTFETDNACVHSDDVENLEMELQEVFLEDGFVPSEHNVSCKDGKMQLTIRMAGVHPVEYDFCGAQKYFSKHLSPETISTYCTRSLSDLWGLHQHVNYMFDDVQKQFDGVAATLRICKEVFDSVTPKA